MVGVSPGMGELYFFGNNRFNRTTDMGENVPWFFSFHSASMGFFKEKISKTFSVPHFPCRRLYSFSSSNTPFPEKWSCPRKNYFSQLFWNYFFFLKKLIRKLFKTFSSKWSRSSTNGFLQFYIFC